MRKRRLTYANITATLALFISLGGVSWAAVTIPNNSVGTRQIIDKGVGTNDLADRAVTSTKIAPSVLSAFKGQKGDKGEPGSTGSPILAFREGKSAKTLRLNDESNLSPPDAGYRAVEEFTFTVPENLPRFWVYRKVTATATGCGTVENAAMLNVRLRLTRPDGSEYGFVGNPNELSGLVSRLGFLVAGGYDLAPSRSITEAAFLGAVGDPQAGIWKATWEQDITELPVGCPPETAEAGTTNRKFWVSAARL